MISLSVRSYQKDINSTNSYLNFPEEAINPMKNQINFKIECMDFKRESGSLLSYESHQILLGSLLGDMHLRKECKNPNIEETHSIKQREYLEWKYMVLSKEFNLKLYLFNNPVCKYKGKIYTRKTEVRLRSNVSDKLNIYYNLFYKERIKKIDSVVLNQLGALGLAVWYCDDGYYDPENHTAEIHTEGFSKEENLLLAVWFNKKWNLKVNFKKNLSTKRMLLRFPVNEADKFLNIIKEHIFKMPQPIWYKLGHLWDGNTSIIQQAKLRKLERGKVYQNKPEVKVRRNQQAKDYYGRNREKILGKKLDYNKTINHKRYIIEYNQRPDVKERRRNLQQICRQNPENKIKRASYQKEYRKKPEVKLKIKEYNKVAKAKLKKGGKN